MRMVDTKMIGLMSI